ncbi:MAG: hypothetical protein Q9165_007302 [Trypethelium subeluteriae]
MASTKSTKPIFFLILSLLIQSVLSFPHATYSEPNGTLTRDVCIIGGGSSGTYSAIRLQQLGLSVALVEKQDRLGGHVNTFVNSSTNQSFDYGVIIFDNISVVTDYFAHLDVPLTSFGSSSGASTNVNFEDGSSVPASNVSETAIFAAFEAYQTQLAQYPYLVSGWQDLPSSLPDDVFLSWGDFIQKYDLGAFAFIVNTFLQGIGNILAQPTLYILKYLNGPTVQNILTDGFLTTANRDNQGLYDKALAELGPNALISSNVTKIVRSKTGVEVTVSTPSGIQKIQASKLVIAIQPKLSSLIPFLDLDEQEQSLFGQFNNSYYWNSVILNSGIPDNVSLSNVNPSNPYGIPSTPSIYDVNAESVAGTHAAWYSSPYHLSDEEVKADILSTLGRIRTAQGYPSTNGTPEFAAFNSHSPFELTVSVDAIKNGFYQQLSGLQGKRNTWWTGATWQGAHDSSVIWNYTEHHVLPQITGSTSN